MKSQRLTFQNQQGETLAARLDLPANGQVLEYAIFAHCFTCSKNLRAIGNINRALTLNGIAVLRFDFTGLGESEGDFADTNFSSNVADLVAAADFLDKAYEAPKLMIGHSLGGAATLLAAGQIASVEAVVTIGAPCDPDHVTQLLESKREEIEETGEAEVNLAGRKFRIKKQFLDDLEGQTMRQSIRGLKKPLLIFHSPIDNTVGIENAGAIFDAALHPKSFVSLDEADHLLSNEDDSRYTGSVIAAWARKYIDLQDKKEPVALAAEEGIVVVQTGAEGYYTEVSAGGHPLVVDEPVSYGGTDLGPSPYQLLSASLGSCTSLTLRMYADRKEWPLESVTVRLKHEKIHAKDCEDCKSENGKVDVIDREIELEGKLSPEQRQRLLEIADKCPVHKTLHSEIKVRTRLRD